MLKPQDPPGIEVEDLDLEAEDLKVLEDLRRLSPERASEFCALIELAHQGSEEFETELARFRARTDGVPQPATVGRKRASS